MTGGMITLGVLLFLALCAYLDTRAMRKRAEENLIASVSALQDAVRSAKALADLEEEG